MPNGKKGFFGKHIRRLSESLPQFANTSPKVYTEKDKYGSVESTLSKVGAFVKRRLGLTLLLIIAFLIFYVSRRLRRVHVIQSVANTL